MNSWANLPLLGGWIPIAVPMIGAIVVAAVLFRRSRRWLFVGLPITIAGGLVGGGLLYWYMDVNDYEPDDAPGWLWLWAIVIGALAIAAAAGWRAGKRWQRIGIAGALPLAMLCFALVANQWVGYYPTLARAWDGISGRPLASNVSPEQLTAMRGDVKYQHTGRVVAMTTPDTVSHFRHRTEYVYLPPEWFHGDTPPALPAMIMLGGVVNTPSDWVRSGNATSVVSHYQRRDRGPTPILVFPDPSGSMGNDTECVDGPRGNAETHLTDEVRPTVISRFGASSIASAWGVAGWSMGGTCAIDLVTQHPDLFSHFIDISGDRTPNAGNRAKTITKLYGGHADRWDHYDPAATMRRHGQYRGVSGWFIDEGHPKKSGDLASQQISTARSLAPTAKSVDIDIHVTEHSGRHNWQFASYGFATALPSVASKLYASTPPT